MAVWKINLNTHVSVSALNTERLPIIFFGYVCVGAASWYHAEKYIS